MELTTCAVKFVPISRCAVPVKVVAVAVILLPVLVINDDSINDMLNWPQSHSNPPLFLGAVRQGCESQSHLNILH